MPPEATNIHSPMSDPVLWGGFVLFMLAAMALDLGLGKRNKAMSTRTAMIWCAGWVSLALTFNLGLYFHPDFGPAKAGEFFAGYLLEYSLSVDNLFIFVLIFAFFRTPLHLQHRALVWGIIGAMIMRAGMILAGAALILKFDWMMAVFGAFLVYSGIKLLFHDEDDDPSQSRFVRFLQAKLPLIDEYVGTAFTVRVPYEAPGGKGDAKGGDNVPQTGKGRLMFTRLFLVVLVIEGSDVIFAVDSVPAIFGVTKDPFIVFTSNMFAILGLRSLFFAIAGAIQKLRFLNYGLAIVLAFIGLKMLAPFLPGLLTWIGVDSGLAAEDLHMSTMASLGVICTVLVVTTILSLASPPPEPKVTDDESPPAVDADAGGSPDEASGSAKETDSVTTTEGAKAAAEGAEDTEAAVEQSAGKED